MTIKYIRVNIIRNLEDEYIVTTITRYLGFETTLDNKDTIIITFDDNTICDTRDEYIDKKYKFSNISSTYSVFPFWVELKNGTRLFYKEPKEMKLNFNKLFTNYEKYKTYKLESSKYNIIYYDNHNTEIVGIVRIKSNDEKPQYLLAYDDKYFDRSDIIYLIECIFKEKFN